MKHPNDIRALVISREKSALRMSRVDKRLDIGQYLARHRKEDEEIPEGKLEAAAYHKGILSLTHHPTFCSRTFEMRCS